jgi:hypothetical protein
MRLEVSQQELIYIAMAFRALARDERGYAEKAISMSVKDAHRNAAETYERLAEKYSNLSKRR